MCAGGCIGGCSCTSNSTALPIGNTGAAGKTGEQGLYGGFSSDWTFSTSTGSGPNSTEIRINSGTYSLASTIYVSNVNANSIDLTAFLDSLYNGGQYGLIRLFKQSDSSVFFYAKLNSVTNNVTEIVLDITYIDSFNTFSASDSVVLTFSPSGAGTSLVLYNKTIPVSTSGGGVDPLMSYNIPVNQLKTDDDVIEIDASFICSGVSEAKELLFKLNGSNFITKTGSGTLYLTKDIKYAKLKLIITRVSSTSLYLTVELGRTSFTYLTHSSGGYSFDESVVGVSDLSSNTLTISCFGQNIAAGSETITQNQLLVRYFNK